MKLSLANKNILLFNKLGYYINKDGIMYNPKGKIIKGSIRQGYYTTGIRVNGNTLSIKMHKLQAYQKYGNAIFNENIVVRHLNGESTDNSWNNIAIGTYKDNSNDIPKNKRISIAIKISSKNRRFTDEEVKQIIKDRNEGLSYSALCKKYNTIRSTLSYFFNRAYYTGKRKVKS